MLNDEDAVANGEPRQGKDSEPVLLFVDGHTSRWSLAAILHLLKHNVFAFCLPSHTSMCAPPFPANFDEHALRPCTPRRASTRPSTRPSTRKRPPVHARARPSTPEHARTVPTRPPHLPTYPPTHPATHPLPHPGCVRSWAQPNDCGVNAAFGWLLGRVVKDENCIIEASKGGATFGKVFRLAYLTFKAEQADKLARDWRNAITSAWDACGLRGELNPNCKAWADAIATFGGGTLLGVVRRSEGGEAGTSSAGTSSAGTSDARAETSAGTSSAGTSDARAETSAGAGTASEQEVAASAAEEAKAAARAAEAQLRRQAADRMVQALLGLLHRGSGSLDLVGVAAPGSAARPAQGSAATASLRGVGKVQIAPCDEDQPVATPRSNP